MKRETERNRQRQRERDRDREKETETERKRQSEREKRRREGGERVRDRSLLKQHKIRNNYYLKKNRKTKTKGSI
jgi:hypothetical protein